MNYYDNPEFNYEASKIGFKNYDSIYDYNSQNINSRLNKLEYYKNEYKALLLTMSDFYFDINNIKKEFDRIKIEYINDKNKNSTYTSAFYNDILRYGNFKITINKYAKTNVSLLESLIHEYRHHLTCINNQYTLKNDILKIRSGFKFTIKNIKTNEVVREAAILNEVYNTYLTSIIMNNIFAMKKVDIKNVSFKNYLDSLKLTSPDGIYKTSSYYDMICLSYPLLMCDEITNLADMCSIKGNIEEFINRFNNEFDYIITYSELANTMDRIFKDNNIIDISNYKKAMEEINYTYRKNRH